jgi:GxxExxY protein
MTRVNELTSAIINAAIEVPRTLGPGLLESAYSACLSFELVDRGLAIEREKPLPVVYRGRRLDCGYRIDLVVDDEIIVEVKAVEKILPVHCSQLLSYLRLYDRVLGLLFNFHAKWLADRGIRRIVNGRLPP